MNVLHSSATNEWYTPRWLTEMARDAMGKIDLDPASCPEANLRIEATYIHCEEDDGLSTNWFGNVWLNPPFGRKTGLWVDKLCREYRHGDVEQACLLVNAVPDRLWFRGLWGQPICFLYKRVRFWQPGGKKNQPTHPNVIVYFGSNSRKFFYTFKKAGHMVMPQGDYYES